MISSKPVHKLHLIHRAKYVPTAFIGLMSEHEDMLCRVLGRSAWWSAIDAEVGDVRGEGLINDAAKHCSCARLNPVLDDAIPLDDVRLVDELADLGRVLSGDPILEIVPWLGVSPNRNEVDWNRPSVQYDVLRVDGPLQASQEGASPLKSPAMPRGDRGEYGKSAHESLHGRPGS